MILRKVLKNNLDVLLVQIIGLGFFLFLGFLSIYFYKERTLSFDTASFVFNLVQNKKVFTPLGRWGSVFSQIIPLFFIKSGCSLPIFLKIYSFGFVFANYLGFLIITLILKNLRLGFVYLFALCLTYRNTFYFSASEFSQGLALVVILSAIIEFLSLEKTLVKKNVLFLFSIILVALLYYFHQLLIIPIIFVLVYQMVKIKSLKNIYLNGLFIFSIFWYGAKLILLTKDSYESSKIPSSSIIIKELPNFFHLPSYDYLIMFFEREFYVIPIIFISGLIILILKKEFIAFLFFIFAFIGYIMLITITYYKGESPHMYEQYFIVIGFMIAFLINYLTPKINIKTYSCFIVIPLVVFGCFFVFQAHILPTKRIEYLNNLTKYGQKLSNKKYIINNDDFPWGYAWINWAVPVETLLYSSLENNKNSIICYVPNKNEVVDTSSNNGQLLGPPWLTYLLNTNILDSNYFKLPKETNYLITKRLTYNLSFIKEKIRYNHKWKNEVIRKATEQKVSVEEMIQRDALYSLRELIRNEALEKNRRKLKIKEIERFIKKDNKWILNIQLKAKTNKISFDEMLRLDAIYIYENPNTHE